MKYKFGFILDYAVFVKKVQICPLCVCVSEKVCFFFWGGGDKERKIHPAAWIFKSGNQDLFDTMSNVLDRENF